MKSNMYLWIISAILLIVSIGAIAYAVNGNTNNDSIYKVILLTSIRQSDADTLSTKALGYYDEASFAYEKSNYDLVESNCRMARDYFSDSSNEYLKVKSELDNRKIQSDLIKLYSDRLELLSEIDLNLYEACEHFESAARYYDVYFNTDVAYGDGSFDMGGKEIESMNDKIDLHDENIRKSNKIYSDFQTKLEAELEK